MTLPSLWPHNGEVGLLARNGGSQDRSSTKHKFISSVADAEEAGEKLS